MSVLSDYVALLRPRYHLLYLTVVITALLFGTLPLAETVQELLVLYVSFCVCLYGSLYTVNAIADRVIDAAHPRKKFRPVASSRVSPVAAGLYAIALFIAALGSGLFLFDVTVVWIYLAFTAANLLYSYVFKHRKYLELIGNSVTYPLRALLGVHVAHGAPPPLLYAAIFLFALGWATTRRIIEKEQSEEAGRPVLRRYKLVELHAVNIVTGILLALSIPLATDKFRGWMTLLFLGHLTVAFLRLHVPSVRRAVGWLLS